MYVLGGSGRGDRELEHYSGDEASDSSMVHGDLGTFNGDKESIDSYLDRFDFYCIANAITDTDRKKAVFMSVVGPEIYSKLRDLLHSVSIQGAGFDVIQEKLKDHFKPQCVEIAERFKFFKCVQRPGQSIADYVAELRNKAKDCNFGTYLDTALRDQLVCGLQDGKCQQELLSKKDVTLSSAVQLARAAETVQREASCFSDRPAPGAVTAGAVNRAAAASAGQRYSARGGASTSRRSAAGRADGSSGRTRPVPNPSPAASAGKSGEECWRCGNVHSGECRFKTYRCRVCQRVGHLARKCRLSSQDPRVHLQEPVTADHEDGEEELILFENVSEPQQPVYIVNRDQVSPPPIWCPVNICNTVVNMELDTGAGVTLIDEITYKKMQNRPKLKNCPTKLRSYTGERISVLGEFVTDVVYHGVSHSQLPVIVVRGSAPCLLGRNWLERMRISWSEVHALRVTPLERLKRKYPGVFSSELGKLKGVKVKLDVDRSVAPKFCKARSLPFAYKNKVEAQLDADVDSGVLVPVRNSRWAAPIVPVVRPDGRIRVCANFKCTANRAVQLDRYPLPKMEEMLAKIGAKRVWSKIDLASAYQQIEKLMKTAVSFLR